MKTYITKPSHLRPEWHVFDATDKTLGRLATEIASLLTGKRNPRYTNNLVTGDYVVVVNAEKISVTGNNKAEQKKYYKHSLYPGGLREISLARMKEKHPTRILRSAVRGMLPKTVLGKQMLSRLKIYAGGSHPHEAQIKVFSRPTTPKFRAPTESREMVQQIEPEVIQQVVSEESSNIDPGADTEIRTVEEISEELTSEPESSVVNEDTTKEITEESASEPENSISDEKTAEETTDNEKVEK
jgi:large subunit ribosomal protein L13